MKIGKYEVSEREGGKVGTAVTFMLIGVGVGALVALLFAPKSGEELRRDIGKKYKDAKDAAEDFAEDARDQVGKVIDRGTEWAEELGEAARKKVAPVAKAIRRG